MVGQRKNLAIKALLDAGLHRSRVHKRIVGGQKELFRDLDGKAADRFGPLGEIFKIDAQDTIDDEIGCNGYVRAFMRHVMLPFVCRGIQTGD